MSEKEPAMLKGTQTRHEREAQAQQAQARKKRHARAKVIGILLAIVVIIAVVAGLQLNQHHQPKTTEQATSQTSGKSEKSSSSASSSSQVQPSNIFGDAAAEISPEKYIKDIYGKTQALYLIVGDSKDMRTQQLAQVLKTDHGTLHNRVPIYFIDANRYLEGNDAKEKIATLQLLNGLGLAKVTGNSVPSQVKFTSTMYANKLTKVNNKAAYTSYTAEGNTFTDKNALQSFLDAADAKLGVN
ncbi:hypothetical protein [Periweissella ghanensis]|uniref:Uncharacterized protein n=1 Tax=Periweissella ghanensis TaxID=467997 RepID=A0ABM8ZBP8_9LACO|nr:hypothetical protein [Periweissella ghanensis]MCM0600773.1 hypothetical protein [Periweissella ghanensis]CAH0418585.1 hypothetical protein WGH24286_01006 [Periweissella ghanensis]